MVVSDSGFSFGRVVGINSRITKDGEKVIYEILYKGDSKPIGWTEDNLVKAPYMAGYSAAYSAVYNHPALKWADGREQAELDEKKRLEAENALPPIIADTVMPVIVKQVDGYMEL